MKTEQRIAAAKEVLHRLQGRYSRPRQRIHDDAALDNTNRLRALEGLCGGCGTLKLKFIYKDGKNRVALRGSKGCSPLTLYDILPALKSGVSLQRRMTYQRSIHLRSKLRSVLECCYKNTPIGKEASCDGYAKRVLK